MFNDFSQPSIEDILQEIYNVSSPIAIDTETTGLNWISDRAFGFSFATANTSYFLRNSLYPIEALREVLKAIFDSKRPLVFHNLKFDAHMIKKTYGIEVPFIRSHDTFTISYLHNNEERHGLKALACKYLSPDADKYEKFLHDYMKEYNISSYASAPDHLLGIYGKKDAEYTYQLYTLLYPQLLMNDKKWYEIERQILKITYQMEEHGILIDIPYVKGLIKKIEIELKRIESEVQSNVGFPIDILSDDQIAKVLYEKEKIPILRRTTPSPTFPN